MLTQLNVLNAAGDELQLPLADASDGYGVANIDGLDPVAAALVSSSFALQDGSEFQASRRGERNIVITLSFEPDWLINNIQTLRNYLYKWFMTERSVNMTFVQSDGPSVVISGVVESFDAPRFAKDVVSTISIMCFKPDFVDPDEKEFSGTTTSSTSDSTCTYDGTVETGFVFTLNVGRSLTGFTLFASKEGSSSVQSLIVDGLPLVSGDTVIISTVDGDKYAKMIHSGVSTNILYAVSPSSAWVNLFPGDNAVRVQTTAGTTMTYTFDYKEKYGGL